MDGANCGECHGPLQCEGASKPVALFPCGDLLHSHCALYIRKTSKLSSLPHACPTCGSLVSDVVPLFVSEVADEGRDEGNGAGDEDGDEPLDVNAMLSRIFHFQRRNMMHQREILESKIELKSVQMTLASVHQRRVELEKQMGAYANIAAMQKTERVSNIPQGELLGLIVLTAEEISQRKRTIERVRALNEAKKRNLLETKRALAQESRSVLSLSGRVTDLASPSSAPVPLQNNRAPKRARVDIISLDSSDDDVCVVGAEHMDCRKVPDVEVLTRLRADHHDDDEELPPLFPLRSSAGAVPPMGVSFKRSLRDLPKSSDVLVQKTL